MKDYQLIIIGSGPAGTAAALQAARQGMRAAVIEDDRAGGTCLNRGCVPTKTLLHASGIIADFSREVSRGVLEGTASVNMPRLFEYKNEVCAKLSDQAAASFKTAGIDLIEGKATLLPDRRVSVAGPSGERILTADDVILATGSVPYMPPIPGLDLPEVLTSDDVLSGGDHSCQSLVIIGGGVIGAEFATFFNDLGVQVTILEGMSRILPTMDKEISQNLTRILKKRGVSVCTKAVATEIVPAELSPEVSGGAGAGVTVRFRAGDKLSSVTSERVLCAVGRRPNTEGLFDEAVLKDLVMEDGRIAADERYRTSLPHVYAVGDLSSKIQLAHVAAAQGMACVKDMAGGHAASDGRPGSGAGEPAPVPACVFTRPEIAVVGLDEQAAKEAGIAVAAGKAALYSNARTVIATDERCFMKILAAKDDHRIVGAQLMCERSSEMISEITEAIVNRLSPEEMLAVVRPHPTFHEALNEALRDLARRLEA